MFNEWLLQQLQERNWSQADLARATGITRGGISNYINGRTPDAEALRKIARALKLSPETVFQQAGILPPVQQPEQEYQELSHLFANASTEEREEILRYARYITQVKTMAPKPR